MASYSRSFVEPLEARRLLAAHGSAAPPIPVEPSHLLGAERFAVFFGSSKDLWRTDGTARGTQKLANLFAAEPHNMQPAGNLVFFVNRRKSAGRELWVTDGTATGTRMVKNINPGKASSDPSFVGSFNNVAFFTADDGAHGRELWRSDGSAEGTFLLKDLAPGLASLEAMHFTLVGNRLFFCTPAGDSKYDTYGRGYPLFALWRTDGTQNGTIRLKTMYDVKDMVSLNGTLIALVHGPDYTINLCRSDGTRQGTVRYVSLSDPTFSGLWGEFHGMTLTVAGEKVFFAAQGSGGEKPIGAKLYAADAEKATLLKDFYSSNWRENGYSLTRGRVFMGNYYFKVGLGSYDSGGSASSWSDGTPESLNAPGPYCPLGNAPGVTVGSYTIFVYVHDQGAGDEPWITDGTEAGTRILADINPGTGDSVTSQCLDSTVLGNNFLFVANDGVHGNGIWVWPYKTKRPVRPLIPAPVAP